MPFIKVSETLYINSDHVRAVVFPINDKKSAHIHFQEFTFKETGIRVTAEAASYFLSEVDTRAAMVPLSEMPTPLLKTRVAQALRYDYPQGVDIITLIADDRFTNDKGEDIATVLLELQDENIAINSPDVGLWVHAANVTQIPDPSDAAADTSLHLEDDTEHSSDR